MSRQFNLQEFVDLLGALAHVSMIDMAVLAGSLALAWGAARLLRGQAAEGEFSVWFGRRIFDGVLFPTLALALVYGASIALANITTAAVFRIAIPILLSLLVIRLTADVLRAALPQTPWVHALERTVSWAAWIAVVLWITGVLPLALEALDRITWKIGKSPVSLRALIEGALTVSVVMMLALWASAAIEKRLMKRAGPSISIRIMAANLVRALLLFIGLMFALSAVGLDLTALSVLGGAVGVGLGFGLQKVAANYVCGFIVLAEHSVRIGDLVRVDGFEGRVTDIRTRYTLLLSANGTAAIVPNETLIAQRVESFTLANPNVQKVCSVRVAYGTEVRSLRPKLLAAVAAVPRVLPTPAPECQLSSFAPDGMDLTVAFWLGDPTGAANVQSDVNLAILDVLNAEGVEIPLPQRVVHQRGAGGGG